MKFFVPYDGSPLAQAALERAGTLTENGTIVVCTVIPDNADYARKKGWIDDEPFDSDDVEQRLTKAIRDVVPDADVRCLHVRPHINAGGIVTRIRDMAEDSDADVVFLGSENVGRIAAPVASIGSNVATRVPYDIYLVQTEANED